MKRNPLRDIEGIQIRKQYFNAIIHVFAGMLPMSIVLCITVDASRGSFQFVDFLKNLFISVRIIGTLILPFAVLSVLNWFSFGKIICVLNGEGLHHKDGCIRWQEIKAMNYSYMPQGRWPDPPGQPKRVHTTVLCTGNRIVNIDFAPLGVFRYAKKFNTSIRFKNVEKNFYVALAVILGMVIGIIPFIA